MRSRRSLLSACLLAAALRAQVPAPDFDLGYHTLTPSSFGLDITVQGPPNSAAYVLFTFDNPFSTQPEQIIIYPLAGGVLNPAGSFTHSTPPVFLQGPLPQCWLATLLVPPGGGYLLTQVLGLGGIFLPFPALPALLPNYVIAFEYDHDSDVLDVDVKAAGGPHTVALWKVPCNQVPAGGAPLNTAPANVEYIGGGNTDANGCLHVDETVPGPVPPETEVCVVATVTIIINGQPTPIVHGVYHIKG